MRKTKTQQQQIRDARKALGLTTAALAAQLGSKLKTLRAWLEPATSKSHRAMPQQAKLLLDRILADHRAKRR